MMFAERFDLYWLISGAVLQGSTHKKEKKKKKSFRGFVFDACSEMASQKFNNSQIIP